MAEEAVGGVDVERLNDLALAQRSDRADRNRTTVPVHRRGDAPSIDIVTRQTVERGFFVIGWDRCTRIDETLWIEGADRARAGLAIAAGLRPPHDLKTVASVDRKRQAPGARFTILVSPPRNKET